mmetsp:Transcript_50031/g.119507  ORF Transcript_50031/g.119507 Transcript_50031/m.119507 type:complete len:212 (-) Transcript_50031:458-1093(-)
MLIGKSRHFSQSICRWLPNVLKKDWSMNTAFHPQRCDRRSLGLPDGAKFGDLTSQQLVLPVNHQDGRQVVQRPRRVHRGAAPVVVLAAAARLLSAPSHQRTRQEVAGLIRHGGMPHAVFPEVRPGGDENAEPRHGQIRLSKLRQQRGGDAPARGVPGEDQVGVRVTRQKVAVHLQNILHGTWDGMLRRTSILRHTHGRLQSRCDIEGDDSQ